MRDRGEIERKKKLVCVRRPASAQAPGKAATTAGTRIRVGSREASTRGVNEFINSSTEGP